MACKLILSDVMSPLLLAERATEVSSNEVQAVTGVDFVDVHKHKRQYSLSVSDKQQTRLFSPHHNRKELTDMSAFLSFPLPFSSISSLWSHFFVHAKTYSICSIPYFQFLCKCNFKSTFLWLSIIWSIFWTLNIVKPVLSHSSRRTIRVLFSCWMFVINLLEQRFQTSSFPLVPHGCIQTYPQPWRRDTWYLCDFHSTWSDVYCEFSYYNMADEHECVLGHFFLGPYCCLRRSGTRPQLVKWHFIDFCDYGSTICNILCQGQYAIMCVEPIMWLCWG